VAYNGESGSDSFHKSTRPERVSSVTVLLNQLLQATRSAWDGRAIIQPLKWTEAVVRNSKTDGGEGANYRKEQSRGDLAGSAY
jgi:hypothetical protein